MTAFLIGFAMCTGPALAWHLYVVARRWPDDTTDRLSGSAEAPTSAAAGHPGPDRSQPAEAQR